MPYRMPPSHGQLDSLHLEVLDRERTLAALADEAAAEGLRPIAPGELLPYGRWLHGDEDPAVRRYLVSPPGSRWITVLGSATDWHHEWCARMARRLECRAVYLMLHDEDVFTLTLADGPDVLVEHVSSPAHFDMEPPPDDQSSLDLAALLAACRPGTTDEHLMAALTPPGPIDVDGRRALSLIAELLEIPPHAALSSYREALLEDGLTVRPEYASHLHVAFREAPMEGGDETEEAVAQGIERGNVVRFPGPRRA